MNKGSIRTLIHYIGLYDTLVYTICAVPVIEAWLILSRNLCRLTAVSNVGSNISFVWIDLANNEYICPTLNGSPMGKSLGTYINFCGISKSFSS